MTTKLTSIKEVNVLDLDALPHGEYLGTWGGYVVRFECEGKQYEAVASQGIRTPCAKCIVSVVPNGVFVQAIE